MKIDELYQVYNNHLAELRSLLGEKELKFLHDYLEKNGVENIVQWYRKNNYLADKLLKNDLDGKKYWLQAPLMDRAMSVYIALLQVQCVRDMLDQYCDVRNTLEEFPEFDAFSIFYHLAYAFLDNSLVRYCLWPFDNYPAPKINLELK